MANTFAEKVIKFTGILDLIYKREALTAILEDNAAIWIGTNKIKVPKIAVQGLGDYDRVNGYTRGNITVTYGEYELLHDRGRSFGVDIIDDDEAGFQVYATASTEFVRTQVIPELDAIRFSTLYGLAGNVESVTYTKDTALLGYDSAREVLFDNDVPEDQLVMFISPQYNTFLKQNTQVLRRIDVDKTVFSMNGIDRRVNMLDGEVPLIRVPRNRFFDSIALLDGTTGGEEAGGYAPIAITSRYLNFILGDRRVMKAYTKHNVKKVISWLDNQTSDENLVFFRVLHDLVVWDNKVNGIFASRMATAFDA